MESLKKVNGYIRRLEEFVLSYSIILMAIILIINVVARMIFNNSLKSAEELSSILTIAVTFIGVSYAARVGRHINMTVLFDIIPVKGKKIFLYISSSITFIALLYLSYVSYGYIMQVFNTGRVTPALGIPMWIPYIVVPIGFLIASMQYVIIFLMNLKDRENYHTCIDPLPDEIADPDLLLMETDTEIDIELVTEPKNSKDK